MGPAQLFFEHASLVYAFKGKDGVLSNLANEGLWFADIKHGTRFLSLLQTIQCGSEPGRCTRNRALRQKYSWTFGGPESWQWVIEVQAQGEPLLC